MNKIRKYLIHLLGGVTGEEHQQEVSYYFKAAIADELRQIKWKMEGCYGQPAEEWCKNIYEYTCKRCEEASRNSTSMRKALIILKISYERNGRKQD